MHVDRIVPWERYATLDVGNATSVLVGGCFDVLHYGHIQFLTEAKNQGDILAVALESDEHIRHRKNREPVHTHSHRAHILSALRVVDYVLLLPYLEGYEAYRILVHDVRPNVIAVTEGDVHLANKRRQAEEVHAHVHVVIPTHAHYSTSRIVGSSV